MKKLKLRGYTCHQCENVFYTRSATAKFCSSACRQKNYRQREGEHLRYLTHQWSFFDMDRLTRINTISPQTAEHIQQMREAHGVEIAREMLTACEYLLEDL
jgi:hypothetical protein